MNSAPVKKLCLGTSQLTLHLQQRTRLGQRQVPRPQYNKGRSDRRRVLTRVTLWSYGHSFCAPDPLPLLKEIKQRKSIVSNSRLKVAVDVDEVLAQFLVALNYFVLETYGMEHNVDDYHVYHFATVWGCSQEFSTQVVHEFFESQYFQQLPLVPGAFDALRELQEWCDLHVVTSRQNVVRDITIEWLSRHYPGIFTSVHFGNHFSKEGGQKKKSEICKEICADVLIDDNPDYAMECASAGIHVLLYNWGECYPWSRNTRRHDRIREVHCWSQIPDALKRLLSNNDHSSRSKQQKTSVASRE